MSDPDLQVALSEREREVLFLAADGLTDKEIAIRLEIGPKTVRTYWDRMRAKLGAASRTEVLAKALRTAYEAISESEERLRLFVENMPVMFNAFDENNSVILANEECTRVTGYDLQALLSPDLYERAIPNDDLREQTLGRLAESPGDFQELETEFTCADGKKRVIAWSSRAKEAPIPGWASWSIGIDVTDRKQAQLALEQSEANYRRLLESSSQGVWVIDTQHRTIFANQRLADMLGCAVDDILANDETFFHDDESRQVMRELIATGPVTGSRTRFTFKFRRADGNDLWAHVDVSPLLDFDGDLYAHAAMITDISRSKALERANLQLRHVNETLLQSLHFIRFDRGMSCVDCRLPGDLAEIKLAGMGCDELPTFLHPYSAWSVNFKKVFTAAETQSFTAKIGPKDNPTTFDVTLLAEPTGQQNVGYVLAILAAPSE